AEREGDGLHLSWRPWGGGVQPPVGGAARGAGGRHGQVDAEGTTDGVARGTGSAVGCEPVALAGAGGGTGGGGPRWGGAEDRAFPLVADGAGGEVGAGPAVVRRLPGPDGAGIVRGGEGCAQTPVLRAPA